MNSSILRMINCKESTSVFNWDRIPQTKATREAITKKELMNALKSMVNGITACGMLNNPKFRTAGVKSCETGKYVGQHPWIHFSLCNSAQGERLTIVTNVSNLTNLAVPLFSTSRRPLIYPSRISPLYVPQDDEQLTNTWVGSLCSGIASFLGSEQLVDVPAL